MPLPKNTDRALLRPSLCPSCSHTLEPRTLVPVPKQLTLCEHCGDLLVVELATLPWCLRAATGEERATVAELLERVKVPGGLSV